MVNTRAILGISLSVLAMAILIAGMSIERWVVAKNEGGQQQYENDMIYIGLKTWSYVPSAPNSVTLTGKLTDDFAPVARDSLVSAADLDAGGNSMIGCGVVALLAGTIGLILVAISLTGKQPRFKALGVFLTVVSLALVVTGTLLYARKMYVYWGFVVFMIAGFMMLFAVIITGGQLFSPIASRQRFLLGTFVTLVSMSLAVAAMSTRAWVSQDNLRVTCSGGSAVIDVGLKRWQITFSCPNNPTYSIEGPLTDLPSGFSSNYRSYVGRLDQGGNYVIGFGTMGLLFAVIGIIGNWLALYQTPKRTTYQIVGLAFTLLSGVFQILGMVLYAQQLYIHASFMMAVASAFLLFSAVIVMIVSSMTFAPSSGSIHGKSGSKHSHRSSTDKAPAADPNAYDPPIVPAAENVSV